MKIEKRIENSDVNGNSEVTILLDGRFGSSTASDVESAVNEVLPHCRKLVFDFSKVDYISSAGLRVLLMAKKKLGGSVPVTVCNANSVVKEIFDISGFSQILQVQ